MTPTVFTPAGFRPVIQPRRAKVLPFRRRRRGLGDAASDYAAIAAQLVPGSALQQEVSGCAKNPTPYCAQAVADALSTPYLGAADYAKTVAAIASGGAPPAVTAYTGAPPGTQIPTVTTTAKAGGPAGDQIAQAAGVTVSPTPAQTPPPAQPVQPAGAPSPTTTSAAPSGSFFSQTFLGFPIWLWGAAAVVGFLIFQQDKGHGW